MARRSSTSNPETIRKDLLLLIENFEPLLAKGKLRQQVKALIPANYLLRDLGSSLIQIPKSSARTRILQYLIKFHATIISGDELMVISGISEYARRIRELRVQYGWKIISGNTVTDMQTDHNDSPLLPNEYLKMKPDDYVLLSTEQDRDAAYRWNIANEIRKDKNLSVRDKLLSFFRQNIGKEISGEELRYIANNKSEWARRTRELRTEYGWPIVSKNTGRPDLPVSVYLLEEDRQINIHDRKIKDSDRREVLMRDSHTCQDCGWKHEIWNPSDPRHLEVHHIKNHVDGGTNTPENLITLCNICHDKLHKP